MTAVLSYSFMNPYAKTSQSLLSCQQGSKRFAPVTLDVSRADTC